ncbi:MAG: sugar phosphate isomerase/epimerase family protein [Acidimicrobiales bacterium]
MTTTDGGGLAGRLAAAPISWGVCEVPGWGVMLPKERVLSEMQGLGLGASELGALGYLGDEPEEIRDVLASFALAAVGGFVPLVLHDRGAHDQLARDAEHAALLLAGVGGTRFVTAAVVDAHWSAPFVLDDSQWDALAEGLAIVDEVCAGHGLVQVLHPHVGTLVEQAADVENVLRRSRVLWCLDTGHLAIGGVDPVAFARENSDHVGLVHLKDVDLELARAVREHETTLLEATKAGLFRALGQGDVDVASVVRILEDAGYDGWYVLEQDTAIDEAAEGSAAPAEDVRASIDFLAALAISDSICDSTTGAAK